MPFSKYFGIFQTTIVFHCAHMVLFENPNPSDQPLALFLSINLFLKKRAKMLLLLDISGKYLKA